jgi:hypothetical protein
MTVTAVGAVLVVVMIMIVAAPGHVDLAMLVIAMPVAIQMAAIGVSVHMAMMVAVPVTAFDVDVLHRLHDAGFDRSGRLERLGLSRRSGQRQG